MKRRAGLEGKYIYRRICYLILSALAAVGFFAVWFSFVEENNQTGHLTGTGNLAMAVGIYIATYLYIGRGLNAFRIGVERKTNLLASQVMTLFCVDVLELFVSMAITGQFRFFNEFLIRYLPLWLLQSFVLCILILPMVNLYRKLFPPLQVLEIIGDHPNKLFGKMNNRPDKYHIARTISFHEEEAEFRREFERYDAVLINDIPSSARNRLLKLCFDMDKRVYFTPKISDIIVKSSEELNLFDTPLYLCRNRGMGIIHAGIKRLSDIVLSGLALIVLSPVMLVVAAAIYFEDKGPVFFRQQRQTAGGREFSIIKFRSMVVDADKSGGVRPAGAEDDRITRVGRVIRPVRLDELPQLINIFRGEMSLVGPRPEALPMMEQYTRSIPEFSYRLKVKGGLTGYAQVYGKYNTLPLDKIKMDLFYIMNYSVLLDVQIMFETLRILFQKESTEGFASQQTAAGAEAGRANDERETDGNE
ncbi:exopolysaccharide biosynthesis polyprenyl glycosylphosphotransferase [Lachnoclostridium sp. Marseille-P6806]|uniref:exopolysaccharide biosynthesis polyprenyl glycosylphosphotransferase n=1 Tax=Lachnoclostridium sp. Marseille-P6806 TaxID=2364793 RepID=UPI001030C5C4|nr:exopolysaccharide biosynthesis polyprenyl glycosylphosphotransferase [Lachnoclostridium sp. Marseille-P6806]